MQIRMMHSKTFLISVRNIAPEHKIQKSTLQEGSEGISIKSLSATFPVIHRRFLLGTFTK